MKRGDLLRHLRTHGCAFLREGGAPLVVAQPGTEQAFLYPTAQ